MKPPFPDALLPTETVILPARPAAETDPVPILIDPLLPDEAAPVLRAIPPDAGELDAV